MKPMSEPNSKPLLTPEERAALPPPPKLDSAQLAAMQREYPQGFRNWVHEMMLRDQNARFAKKRAEGREPQPPSLPHSN